MKHWRNVGPRAPKLLLQPKILQPNLGLYFYCVTLRSTDNTLYVFSSLFISPLTELAIYNNTMKNRENCYYIFTFQWIATKFKEDMLAIAKNIHKIFSSDLNITSYIFSYNNANGTKIPIIALPSE